MKAQLLNLEGLCSIGVLYVLQKTPYTQAQYPSILLTCQSFNYTRTYLRGQVLRSTTESTSAGPKKHLLLAQAKVCYLDVTIFVK